MSGDGLTALLTGRTTAPVPGRPGWSMCLLTAAEVLEARREAGELARGERERALCSNACLLARALRKGRRQVFPSGLAVLEALRVEEIEAMARAWAGFNQRENPSAEDGEERLDSLKKAWSTRRMSALNGVCSKALGCCPGRRRRGK